MRQNLVTSRICLIASAAVIASADFTKVYQPGKTAIIQYGAPRTATTLQHEILSYIASLVNVDLGLPRTGGGFVGAGKGNVTIHANAVYKTHDLGEFEYAMRTTSLPVMLFVTASSAESPGIDKRAVYVQEKRVVELDPLAVIDDYAKIFNMTQQQIEKTKAFIRVWDIWRLCCGLQQSLANRLVLHKCPPLISWFDPANPHCELYDLGKVDALVKFSTSHDVAIDDFADLGQMFQATQYSEKHSCLNYQAMIEGGKDFNGQRFKDCPSLIKQHVPKQYQDYVCRNAEYADLCKQN